MFLIILAIVIIIGIIEDRSIKNALKGIEYSQKPSLNVLEPDEEFEIISVLQNRTRRFVAYLRVKEKFSTGFCLRAKGKNSDAVTSVQSSHFLMPKQRLERRIKASISKRGRYFLYGAEIFGGDFLGLTEIKGDYAQINEVVVLPREVDAPDIEVTLGGFIGDVSINRFILEDPILTAGFNDYTGYEPQKMISWTQSARMDKLMVKNYDYTLEMLVTVLLNVDCVEENHDELIERCFSIGRTVCQFLEGKNIKFKFMTNTTIVGANAVWRNTNDGWGENFLMGILEGLGRAIYVSREPFEKTLFKALDYAELGRGHIIITPTMNDEYTYAKEKLRELTGIDVCVIEARQEV